MNSSIFRKRPASWLVPALVVLGGVALHIPTLRWGFFADDYGHRVILHGVAKHATLRPWNLYDFGTYPDPSQEMWTLGSFPWWTSPDWKIRFFRPVTSVSLWADHALWGDWAVGHHLTGLVLFGVYLVLAYALFGRMEEHQGAVLLALALAGAGAATLFSVGWPANRNSLLAQLFLAASLLAVVRPGGVSASRKSWIAAWACAALAALSKESGVVTFLLLALLGGKISRRHRRVNGEPRTTPPAEQVRALERHASGTSLLLAATFVLGIAAAGFGARGLFYATPWLEPMLFAQRVATLLAAAPLSLIGLFSTDLFLERPRTLVLLTPFCLLLSGLLARWVWRAVRGNPFASFLAGWFALGILPQGGAPTSDRLLFEASLPASLLLGGFLCRVLRLKWTRNGGDPQGDSAGRVARVAAWLILVLAVPGQAAIKLALGGLMARVSNACREIMVTADVGPPELGRREAFVLNAPNTLVLLNGLSTWAMETGDFNVRFWPMQFGRRGLEWRRIDERTFDLESLDEPFLTGLLESVFLTSKVPPAPGTRWETALCGVQATKSDASGLRAFRVTCPESLDAPHYRFLVAEGRRWIHVSPPAVGASIRLNRLPAAQRLVP